MDNSEATNQVNPGKRSTEWEQDDSIVKDPSLSQAPEDPSASDKPTTVRKQRPRLTEQQFLSNKGLQHLYDTFPHDLPPLQAGKEEKALHNLMLRYREWAFDLYPKLAFEDFVERGEEICKKHSVHALLSELRDKERQRQQDEAYL